MLQFFKNHKKSQQRIILAYMDQVLTVYRAECFKCILLLNLQKKKKTSVAEIPFSLD